MQIRPLTPEDAPQFLEVRLRALREHPEAFAMSEAEERERPFAEHTQRLRPGPEHVSLGAFDQDRLVGMVALLRPLRPKLRHRATVAGMYVAPEARRKDLGRALLDQALQVAGEWGVREVALAVTVGNHSAQMLYESRGFISYGTEPRALHIEGCFYDVELMNLQCGSPPHNQGGPLDLEAPSHLIECHVTNRCS